MRLALLWLPAAPVTLAAIAWASRRRRRPLPEEAALVFALGEPVAYVLTDLGVARVAAPTDLAGIERVTGGRWLGPAALPTRELSAPASMPN